MALSHQYVTKQRYLVSREDLIDTEAPHRSAELATIQIFVVDEFTEGQPDMLRHRILLLTSSGWG